MAGFDIIALEQGSREWHRWRLGGLGASDAPVVMRDSPHRTIADLRRERLPSPGRNSPGRRPNRAMIRGNLLEPTAREAYCRRKGITVVPLCLQSREHPWMRCSLDGICLDTMQAVEIKCGSQAYRRAAHHGAAPRAYVAQLQHTMAVAGLTTMDLWCYLPGKAPLLIPVARDQDYIDRLISCERAVWDSINPDQAPKACNR